MKSTSNNRGKMKKKTNPKQVQTFWNLNNTTISKSKKPKQKQAKKLIFVQQRSNTNIKNHNKSFNLKLSKQINFNPKVKKQKWITSTKPFTIAVNKTQLKKPKPSKQKLNNYGKLPFMGNGNGNFSKNIINKQKIFGLNVPEKTLALNNINNKRSQNLEFLYGAVQKRVETINEQPMKMFTPIKMTPSSIFKKETIYQKHLNPWGDADMDGSVNHMDCDPREVAKDGIVGDVIGKIGGAVRGLFGGKKKDDEVKVSEETFSKLQKGIKEADIEEKKKQRKAEMLKIGKEAYAEKDQPEPESKPKKSLREKISSGYQNVKSTISQAGKDYVEAGTDISTAAKGAFAKRVTLPLGRSEHRKIAELRVDLAKARKAEKDLPELTRERDIVNEEYKKDMRRLRSIDNKIAEVRAAGKSTKDLENQRRIFESNTRESFNTLKELTAEVKSKKSLSKTQEKVAEKIGTQKSSLTARRQKAIGGILSTLTPLGAVPEIRRLASANISGSKKGKKGRGGGGGRGRPSGPSGKYVVDGEPVTEAEYQQIRAIENKKRRTLGMTKIPTKSYALNTIKQAVPRQEAPQAVQQIEEQEPRHAVEVGPPINRGTVLQEQMREQQEDNILKAPNINKGELSQTAGIFHEDPRYNILNAPDVNKGGLRNVGQTEESHTVNVGERPNPNPYGTEYTEIEPGTGRVLLKRRPQEKWATGEAL